MRDEIVTYITLKERNYDYDSHLPETKKNIH